jgi:hypothetical protein
MTGTFLLVVVVVVVVAVKEGVVPICRSPRREPQMMMTLAVVRKGAVPATTRMNENMATWYRVVIV